MAKVEPIQDNGNSVGYLFECPGCKMPHEVYVKPHTNDLGASWTFNGDLEKPTFSPSIRVNYTYPDPSKSGMLCHSFVVDGEIRFLSDSTHSLKGQTVALGEIE
ncbi:MAG: DUF6527 family protein [Cyanobacteria bacterium J06639_14]